MTAITVDQIYEVIKQEAPTDLGRIDPDATLESLGIASLDVISVLFALEDKFGLVIDQADVEHAKSVGEFVAAIKAKADAAPAGA